MPEAPALIRDIRDAQQKKLADEATAFENSDFLKDLRARSDAKKVERKKEIADKYCMRQAELGIGDCGGLKLIPGMTKSGKQKMPEGLANFFGIKDEDYYTGKGIEMP